MPASPETLVATFAQAREAQWARDALLGAGIPPQSIALDGQGGRVLTVSPAGHAERETAIEVLAGCGSVRGASS